MKGEYKSIMSFIANIWLKHLSRHEKICHSASTSGQSTIDKSQPFLFSPENMRCENEKLTRLINLSHLSIYLCAFNTLIVIECSNRVCVWSPTIFIRSIDQFPPYIILFQDETRCMLGRLQAMLHIRCLNHIYISAEWDAAHRTPCINGMNTRCFSVYMYLCLLHTVINLLAGNGLAPAPAPAPAHRFAQRHTDTAHIICI